MAEIILVHGSLVGPGTLEPTANVLRQHGHRVQVPTVPAGTMPAWRDWPEILLSDLLPDTEAPVVIGHSMGSRLAARLVAPLGASAFIVLDGDIPPETGPVPPVQTSFLALVDRLPQADGMLPPWHEWWSTDPLEGAEVDEAFKNQLFLEVPRLPRLWFDDSFEMTPWAHIPKGYICLGAWYAELATKAEQEGWTTTRSIPATHMHPATRPEQTAAVLLECLRACLR